MKKKFLVGALLLGASQSGPVLAAPVMGTMAKAETPSAFSRPLLGEKRYAHLLDRLAFGPRPGDIEVVRQTGIKAWIEMQLAPQKIDDSALEAQLASLTWLQAPPQRLALAYQADTLNVLRNMKKAEKGRIQAPVITPAQQMLIDQIEAANMEKGVSLQALGELSTNKLARAISSNRQLREVLVDFWSNHFNVDVNKGPTRTYKIRDEVDVIRPSIFGNFREMLGASAHSPAMLHYLDNARSTREMVGRGKGRGGLNENYARELMELHTLGVDGGYSQADVTEVARCFTGWSIDRESGQFFFRQRAHDTGDKTMLGQKISNSGVADGERVLDILATHPATARFIAQKLCVRFVADEPPAAVVEKVAAAFIRSKGDLAITYHALFLSPEFLSEGAYRSKIKSPFEFTVSAVRALNGTVEVGGVGGKLRLIAVGGTSLNRGNRGMRRQAKQPLAASIAAMGQPLFSCSAPTGYAEDSRKWVSSSALVARLNFALALAEGRVGDVVLKEDTFRAAPVEAIAKDLLHGEVSPSTLTTIQAEAKQSPDDGARLRALLLGSPEFQRR